MVNGYEDPVATTEPASALTAAENCEPVGQGPELAAELCWVSKGVST